MDQIELVAPEADEGAPIVGTSTAGGEEVALVPKGRGVSVLILTLNEEDNLPACLASVAWCDDIVVLDSYSRDRTVDIARAAGVRVERRRFDNWSSQLNWALENIPFRHEWVFNLDADERMTPVLTRELHEIASTADPDLVAFYCGPHNHFMGRWIRHAWPPIMVMRYFRPDRLRFERIVHPKPVIDGRHGYLKHHFDHFNTSKGMAEWFDKHNRYSDMEAVEGVRLRKGHRDEPGSLPQPSLFAKDAATRRRALKTLSFRMPFRPVLKFVYLYLLKRGFLDGREGFAYCMLQSFYEYMIDVKMMEIQRRERGLPV